MGSPYAAWLTRSPSTLTAMEKMEWEVDEGDEIDEGDEGDEINEGDEVDEGDEVNEVESQRPDYISGGFF